MARVPVMISWSRPAPTLFTVSVYTQVLCWSWSCLISNLQRVDNSLLSLLLDHQYSTTSYQLNYSQKPAQAEIIQVQRELLDIYHALYWYIEYRRKFLIIFVKRNIYFVFMNFKSCKISPWLTLFAFITLYDPFIFINALFDNTKKSETFSSWYSVFCTVCSVWTVEVWSQPLEKSRLFRFSYHYSTLHNTGMDPYICSKGCRRDGWLQGRKLKIISPRPTL